VGTTGERGFGDWLQSNTKSRSMGRGLNSIISLFTLTAITRIDHIALKEVGSAFLFAR